MKTSEVEVQRDAEAACKTIHVVARESAAVEETLFQGQPALSFSDPANPFAVKLEQLVNRLTTVIATESNCPREHIKTETLLLLGTHKWVVTVTFPPGVSDECIAKVVARFLAEVVVQDAQSDTCTSDDAAQLTEEAAKALDREANALKPKRGGHPAPACSVWRGEHKLASVAGTLRPRPDRTELVAVEVPIQGCLSGYDCDRRAGFLMVDGKSKLTVNWESDAIGDTLASLSSTPSERIPVSGVLAVTKDAGGTAIYEVKSVWRK